MVIGDVGQSSWVKKYNKLFKSDSQRVAFYYALRLVFSV